MDPGKNPKEIKIAFENSLGWNGMKKTDKQKENT